MLEHELRIPTERGEASRAHRIALRSFDWFRSASSL
jgi:hypothetical protein